MHDVPPQSYTTVLRDMIKHENELTNHRIMWLLIGQGFIANAYVSEQHRGTAADYAFPITFFSPLRPKSNT